MYTYSLTMLRRHLSVLVAICAVGVAIIAAGPAHAQPKDGTGAKGCPVEHEHGTISYVPVGTRIGLFVCGSDGEWRFGWLIDARFAEPSAPTTGPPPAAIAAKLLLPATATQND